LLASVSACSDRATDARGPAGVGKMKIEAVLEKNEAKLMSIPGVVGVGIGGSDEAPVILVMATHNATELKKKLPSQIAGFPVKVEVSGEIRAF
jgi:hypothetical protein